MSELLGIVSGRTFTALDGYGVQTLRHLDNLTYIEVSERVARGDSGIFDEIETVRIQRGKKLE